MSDFFNVDARLTIDNDSTSSYNKVEYQLQSGLLPNTTNYDIEIKNQHDWFLLSESYLQVEFDLYSDTAKTTRVVDGDRIALNTPWALFEQFQLNMFNKAISDSDVAEPGLQVMMQQAAQASTDFQKSIQSSAGFYPMLNQCPTGVAPTACPALNGTPSLTSHPLYSLADAQTLWFPYNDKKAPNQYAFTKAGGDSTGSFNGQIRPNEHYDENFVRSNKDLVRHCSYMLPLRDIYPFLSQALSKVTKGANLKLQWRKRSDVAKAFYINGAAIGGLTVDVTKLSLWTVQMAPSLKTEAMLSSIMANNKEIVRDFEQPYLVYEKGIPAATTSKRIQISAKAARPLKCFVAFRLAASDASRGNSHNFEGINMKELHLRVNGKQFPEERYRLDEHPTRVLSDLHKMVLASGDFTDGSLINYDNFTNGPMRIYGIDLSAVAENVFQKNVSDVELRYELSQNAPGIYDCYILLISEKQLTQELVNQQMKIRF